VNVPLSVWYLTFYCNPRLKEAVVNKILMDGFHATAVLYGKYVEKYLHSEEMLEGEEVTPQEINRKVGGYNVSSVFSVIMYHILYILICPILALKEFGNVLKNSINRDLGGLKKNDPKVFDTNPVILVKD